MRRAHYLKDNKSSDYPQQCIWFDTETLLEDESGRLLSLPESRALRAAHEMDETFLPRYRQVLNFGYACYMRKHREGVWSDEEWLHFTTRDEFWRWVDNKTRPKTKLYLLCHNTGFDLPVLDLFNELPSYGWTLISAIIDAPPTICRFRNGTKSIVVLDTLNFWRMPLKYLGEQIGLEKLDMPDNNDMTVDWESYGKRDVEILRTASINWWQRLQDHDMGSFSPTLAGQSMQCYRHSYMHHKIFIDDNERSLKLTREGYYGGRVECFRIGKYVDNFSALDINSMYPSVMAVNKFPTKLISHTSYASVRDIEIWLRQYCVTARVLIRTDKPFACVRRNNKLIFPVGEFECILSTPELIYALTHAEIVEVYEVSVYECEYIFTDMVHALYEGKSQAKRTNDLVLEFLYKKLLNSFYGKWGQSGGKWTEEMSITDLSCKSWLEYDCVTGRKIRHRQLGGLRQVQEEPGETRDSFPAIAGHVTAHARMDLWRVIEKAGTKSVYYTDTDCIIVDPSGAEKLVDEIDDYHLGALKLAGTYSEIHIYGNKDYRFGSKVKTKGVRKDAIWLDGHTVKQEQWSGLKGLVTSGKMDAPITKTIIKHLSRLYEKGLVSAEGLVTPYRLPLAEPLPVSPTLFDADGDLSIE